MTRKRRGAGRPRKPIIDRGRILAAGLALLEQEGLEATSMRAIARRLRVDPMALYHYFGDRDALLRAAAELTYRRLAPRRARGWRAGLEALAVAYLRLLGRSGELLRYLTQRADASRGPTERFRALFDAAVGAARLRPRDARAVHDTYVDFLHGFALGGAAPRARLRSELQVLFAGISTLSQRGRMRVRR